MSDNRFIQIANNWIGRALEYFGFPDAQPASLLSGCNGPHGDNVNNLRVVCHVLVMAVDRYRANPSTNVQRWINSAIDHIFSFQSKDTAIFHHRTQPGKDPNNGLIGQVWVWQALIFAWEHLDSQQKISVKRSILAHDLDNQSGLWTYPVLIGGEVVQVQSYTLNQQLWFYHLVDELNELFVEEIFPDARAHFLERLADCVRPSENSLNLLVSTAGSRNYASLIRNWKKVWVFLRRKMSGKSQMVSRAYTPFALWAIYSDQNLLAALDRHRTELDRLLTNLLLKTTSVIQTENPFGWGYNLTGVEVALAYYGGQSKVEENSKIDIMLRKQSEPQNYTIADEVTFWARQYEWVYLREHFDEKV